MHLSSSRFVLLAGLAAALAPGTATAQTWPAKPIRFVVPFAAGGANDLMARAAAEGVSERLGQPVVIENKPGAGAVLGADIVAKSRARRLHLPDQRRWRRLQQHDQEADALQGQRPGAGGDDRTRTVGHRRARRARRTRT